MTQTFNILNADGKMVDQILSTETNAEEVFEFYLRLQPRIAQLTGAVKAVAL